MGIKKTAVDKSQNARCEYERCLHICVRAESSVFDGGCSSERRLTELV